MPRSTGLDEMPVHFMDTRELDMHMDVDHDRDAGERGLHGIRDTQVAVHQQLHAQAIWKDLPHTHGETEAWGSE